MSDVATLVVLISLVAAGELVALEVTSGAVVPSVTTVVLAGLLFLKNGSLGLKAARCGDCALVAGTLEPGALVATSGATVVDLDLEAKLLLNLVREIPTAGVEDSVPFPALAGVEAEVDSGNLLRPENNCLLDFLVVEVVGRRVVLEAAGAGVVLVVVLVDLAAAVSLVWNLLFLLPNMRLVEAVLGASVEGAPVSWGVVLVAKELVLIGAGVVVVVVVVAFVLVVVVSISVVAIGLELVTASDIVVIMLLG